MSYNLSVEKKSTYLHITVRGTNNRDNVVKYLSEVQEHCLKNNSPNVLIEENLEGPGLSTFTMYDIITEASKRLHPDIFHIAYVDVNPEHNMTDLQFAENVAVNRSVNVKIFPSVAEAEHWLKTITGRK